MRKHQFGRYVSLSLLVATVTSLFLPLLPATSVPAYADNHIVVDHTSVELFEEIPTEYLVAASQLRMHYFDRSVGDNIRSGLDCLAIPDDQPVTNSCRRGLVEAGEPIVHGTIYNNANWRYDFLTGDSGFWNGKIEAFINATNSEMSQYDVFNLQISYLEGSDPSIVDPSTGMFVNQSDKYDIYDLVAHEEAHPDKVFIYATTSISRGADWVSTDVNNQIRQFAEQNDKILFDIADIESHTVTGEECYDNRDGVEYCSSGVGCENHPDDGINTPAICQMYTKETDGGHLGNPDTGKMRIAKAFWVLMAQIAGWDPEGNPPTNSAPVVNAGADQTITLPTNSTQMNATVTDDGLPSGNLTRNWSQISGAGTAQFSNQTLEDPTVTFSSAGVYGLRLTVSDGQLQSYDDVLVTVNAEAANQPPVAQNGSYTTAQDAAIGLTLGYTDGDGPGPYSYQIVSFPAHGLLTGSGANRVYTPNAGYYGLDTFTWRVSDGLQYSNVATVTLNVTPYSSGPSPIAQWDFTGGNVAGSGCTDCVNNGATVIAGRVGDGLYFDGNDNVDLGDFNFTDSLPQISVTYWIKPDFDNTWNEWEYAFSDGGSLIIFYLSEQRNWRASLRTTSGTQRITTDGLSWSTNDWHHVAVTYNGSVVKMYWNGVEVGSANHTGTVVGDSLHGRLGMSPSGQIGRLNGGIDELKVYDVALSASEVLQQYQSAE